MSLKNLPLLQEKSSFCYGIDAVLLSNFVQLHDNNKVCDLCSGNAIIPLLLIKKNPNVKIDAVEIQKQSCELAEKNVALNEFQSSIKIHNINLVDCLSALKKNSYDAVTCNPPYISKNEGTQNPNQKLNAARHEIFCTLDDVVNCASCLLKSNGNFFMIHKPHRLSEIFELCRKYKMEIKTMQFVQPKKNKMPNMVLIHAQKCAKPFLKILPVIEVYKEHAKYSDAVQEIYDNLILT